MTPGTLARRDTASLELMDDPGCDVRLLERTYRQFATINRLVSGWRRIYRARIRPRLATGRLTTGRPATLLDIGFGGGDIPRAIARWAARDRLALDVTAIDPDPRAMHYVRRSPDVGVRFERATSDDVVARGDRYDVVISNHLLHHLDDGERDGLLRDSAALARELSIHNDLERARLGYAVFAVTTLPLRGRSFAHEDGLLSIRRSYRRDELRAVVPQGWRVEAMFPQRLLLTRDARLARDALLARGGAAE